MQTSLPLDLTGKVALVTGASRGLGRAIAIALARAGADVALGLRDATGASGLESEIKAMQRGCAGLAMDVLDLAQSYVAIDRTIEQFGSIDILVNNVAGAIEGYLLDVTEADFDRQLAINVRSTFFISQYVAKHMKARGSGGSIVNMASQAGLVALPNEGVYCTSKAAIIHMTKCMAVEWGGAQHSGQRRCPDLH